MRIVRFQQKRFYIVLIFIILILFTAHFLWNNTEEDVPCTVSPDIHKKLSELLLRVKDAVKALNISHFICYNSLWGALKVKGPLPWQNSLELCVLNKELSQIDEGFLVTTFKHYGLSLDYNSAGGFYNVLELQSAEPLVTLTVFEQDPLTAQMRRVGWIHRMLPPNSCEELNCFPPDLITAPLPIVTYGGVHVPAPRQGIEIQKYLFPYSWWKEIAPPGCNKDKDSS